MPAESALPPGCEILLLEDDAPLRKRLAAHLRHLGAADLSAVGPGLGMAVLTTLYGAVFANVVILPLGAKLHAHLVCRASIMHMAIEGTLLVYRREYPTRVERALRAYAGASRGAATPVAAATESRLETHPDWNDDLVATGRAA